MNPTFGHGVSFEISRLFVFLLLLVLFLIPGTILGWVAAGRIRQSGGKLYGLRLAAFAAVFAPALLLILVPVLSFILTLRVGKSTPNLSEDSATLVGAVVFASLALLSVKIFQGCLRKLLGKGAFHESFGLRKNRLIVMAIALLWIGLGVIFYLQRPRLLDKPIVEVSPDGSYQAKGSTWHRMHVFDSDEIFYRFELLDLGNNRGRVWERNLYRGGPVAPGVLSASSEDQVAQKSALDYRFGNKGMIQWTGDSSEVNFLLNGSEIFRASAKDWSELPPRTKPLPLERETPDTGERLVY